MATRKVGFEPAKAATPVMKRKRTVAKVTPQAVEITHTFDGFLPGDVAVALKKALEKEKITHERVQTLTYAFGQLIQSPFDLRQVKLPSGEIAEIGWGSYDVEGLGRIQIQMHNSGYKAQLLLFPKDGSSWDEDIWDRIIAATEKTAPSIQLYHGRAFKLGDPTDLIFPQYIYPVKGMTLFLNDEVEDKLRTSLWDVIEMRERLLAEGTSVRRGVIMHGHYGTGKTTAAAVTSEVAIRNGYGFISITGRLARAGYKVAGMIQPAVLWIEDLDEVTHGDRDTLNSLLNTVSSIESKVSHNSVIILVSTNFIDRIDRAFLRPERFDTLVEMQLPNAVTAEKMIRATAGTRLPASEDIREVCEYLADASNAELGGSTPAIIAEAVTLSRIRAVKEGRSITAADLMRYAVSLDKQRSLANPVFKRQSVGDNLAQNIRYAVRGYGGEED